MGCRRVAGQDELTRLVRSSDGTLRIGRALPGRGAWLCSDSLECLEGAIKRQAFGRSFRSRVSPEAVAALRAELAVGESQKN